MNKSYTYEQLIEKIVRAKMKLEGGSKDHSDRCAVELDPEGYAPCSCGASSHNSSVQAAIDELKL